MNASTAPMSNALTPKMGDISYIKTLNYPRTYTETLYTPDNI